MGFASMRSNGDFSRRHYIRIGKLLNYNYQRYKALDMEWATAPLDDLTKQFCDMFRYDNPNFKYDKFIEAVRYKLDET